MKRRWTNENASFAASIAAHSKEVQAALNNRRVEMKGAWDALDKGWKELEGRMVAIGITKPANLDNCVVHLNAGGLHLNVRRAALESMHQKTLTNLFDAAWDSRVPRDKDGRIFFDESSLIVKLLVHIQLMATKEVRAYVVGRRVTTSTLVAADQLSYMTHVARVFGLQNSLFGSQAMGVSTVLKGNGIKLLSGKIRSWCPGDPQCLELIYQASLHGLNAYAFHAHCTDESPSTLTLVKVHNDGIGGGSSVIGGFSSVPWTGKEAHGVHYHDTPGVYHYYFNTKSPNAFIFVVKDGSATEREGIQPVKFALPRDSTGHPAVRRGKEIGPDFGNGGFRVTFTSPCRLKLSSRASQVFKNLAEKRVSEIEVYRFCHEPGVPVCIAASGVTEETGEDIIAAENVHSRLFGDSIAGALMEERMALNDARVELGLAEKKVEAAACALAAVYGPDIALGEPDPVVELSVRGTRMATLRSTLQVCPESALAARFDESKWPSNGKDFGVIDCSPSSFSKVLDVLRMRKREKWFHRAPQQGVEINTCLVAVTAEDRASFEEFMGMYFPGCESFVMDVVDFQTS